MNQFYIFLLNDLNDVKLLYLVVPDINYPLAKKFCLTVFVLYSLHSYLSRANKIVNIQYDS